MSEDITMKTIRADLAEAKMFAAPADDLLRQAIEALRELMEWAGPIAGDNRDAYAAEIEVATTNKASAVLAIAKERGL